MASTKTSFENRNLGITFDEAYGEISATKGAQALRDNIKLKQQQEHIQERINSLTKEMAALSNSAVAEDKERLKALTEVLKNAEQQKWNLEGEIESNEVLVNLSKERLGLSEDQLATEKEKILAAERLEAIERERQKRLRDIASEMRKVKYDSSLSVEERQSKLKELRAEETAEKKRQERESGGDVDKIIDALGQGAQDIFGGDLGSMISSSLKDGFLGDQLGPVLDSALSEGGWLSELGGSVGGAFAGVAESLGLGGIAAGVGEMVPGVGLAIMAIKQVAGILNFIKSSLDELRKSMTQSIEKAAGQMSSYYSRINANLEGSIYSSYGLLQDKARAFDAISNDTADNLGFSRLIKQTDYLNQIATLSDAGLVNDIEQRALLEAIKDKALTSFDVQNESLTRLVRLGEQSSINQFGVELTLKRMLNKFGDSSYLQSLFDSVSDAILDASIGTTSELTYFNSTVQTWLGAMYSSGMSNNIVNSIAQGINALGSGNISALSGNESMQRLLLLSMDRVGLDYADILQQGLTAENTNKLLSSIIEYLNEIATNTEDNLVLKSSYSGLFDMSITDMKAIQNVYSKMGEISGNIVNAQSAATATINAISAGVSNNTLAAEKFNNLFENFSYSFGSTIAENSGLYTTYKIADITYNMLDKFSQVGGVIGKIADVGKKLPAAIQYGIGTASFIGMLGNLGSFSNKSLLGLLESPMESGVIKSGSSISTSTSSTSNESTSFKTFSESVVESSTKNLAQQDSWSADESGDDELGILQEISKALMVKDGNYAFAVSLEGMNNEVLKSFASIFADEDAMMKTFQGDNKVLQQALFGYMGDTTSNTNANTGTGSTKGSTNTASSGTNSASTGASGGGGSK